MGEVLNLSNLREMTGGDPFLEKELFTVFISSSEECLQSLQQHTGPNDIEHWKRHAHAWKGISLNLGAENLAQLCKSAQDNYMAEQEIKQRITETLQQEYSKVKSALNIVMDTAS